jgi:hypothetical protein
LAHNAFTFFGSGIDGQEAAGNLGALDHARQAIAAEGIPSAERALDIEAVAADTAAGRECLPARPVAGSPKPIEISCHCLIGL